MLFEAPVTADHDDGLNTWVRLRPAPDDSKAGGVLSRLVTVCDRKGYANHQAVEISCDTHGGKLCCHDAAATESANLSSLVQWVAPDRISLLLAAQWDGSVVPGVIGFAGCTQSRIDGVS